MSKKTKSKTMELDGRILDSVKLVYGGIHGVIVSFSDVDDQMGIHYKNQYKNVKFGAPASGDLVNAFNALKGELLDICAYPMEGEDRAVLEQNTEVTGITFKNERGLS